MDLVKYIEAAVKKLVIEREAALLKTTFEDYPRYMYARGAIDTAYASLMAVSEAVDKYKRDLQDDDPE